MHGNLATNAELLRAIVAGLGSLQSCRVVVCAPFPYLGQVQALIGGTSIAAGAQDVSAHERGAYTGQVAPAMLREFGCSFVIVGHSERRALCGETSKEVAAKAAQALSGGLVPIVCVGETLEEREAGRTEGVVSGQLEALLAAVSGQALERVVLAYEPVWAIGTGKTARPEEAEQVHAMLRAVVRRASEKAAAGMPILYGGSVKPGNAKELFAQPDIDGGLIGGASLVAQEFVAIADALGAARAG